MVGAKGWLSGCLGVVECRGGGLGFLDAIR